MSSAAALQTLNPFAFEPIVARLISSNRSKFVHQDALRSTFALYMSVMYKAEVPLYGDLIEIVRVVNEKVISSSPERQWGSERLDVERHGAIRLGSPQELSIMRRLLAAIGLHPVGYYDLSVAGLPMHATAFRPLTQESLTKSPFRIFCTLLRPELLDNETRTLAMSFINKRRIFTAELLDLIGTNESQGGLTEEQGEAFTMEAMKTFRWQGTAVANLHEYNQLRDSHPIIADIACFGTAHINHLTPRTLDIDQAQEQMRKRGMAVKSRIEGPPLRAFPILLRQTSFLALEESVSFRTTNDSTNAILINGSHKARFGEIEQRGAAVTLAGRQLYDSILSRVLDTGRKRKASADGMDHILQAEFAAYPDTLEELIDQRLIYCIYTVDQSKIEEAKEIGPAATIRQLLARGVLHVTPQIYEDFLPLSAAGIFLSNLGKGKAENPGFAVGGGQDVFEQALGAKVHDPEAFYQQAQQQSLEECARILRIEIRDDC
ncbi:duf1338 domain protein [Curvularia clavata]|uniref:2-oxoadipate dioxygenase/decarboxylase n=1 Tax=Curvularia clavata TaxID=95742 RepID=A0A9Q8ZD93_CURCL|nr:duf1338 domain protein [Curvularia clavata]